VEENRVLANAGFRIIIELLFMKSIARAVLGMSLVVAITSGCASPAPKPGNPHKKLKLETIDHGPMRPKTYLYREVDA
jgi:hypothetical protein